MRFAFIKAGDNQYQCGNGTNCQLSGNLQELINDLKYLSSMVNASTQMTVDNALTKAANLFSTSSGRQQNVIIIAADTVTYVNSATRQLLPAKNIPVVGVALDSSNRATISLKNFVNSPPSQYILGVQIDAFESMFLDNL